MVLLLLSAPAPHAATAQGPSYDVLILGGRIVDGAGAAWFYGDIAVQDAWISRVTPPGGLADA